MKIRQGFVSNSSSSSFVCMVSGHIEAGMDMSMADAGMVECIHGHQFGEEYIVGDIRDENMVDDWRYEISAEQCPICSLTNITNGTVLAYILKEDDINLEMMKNKIRSKFKDNSELLAFLKG